MYVDNLEEVVLVNPDGQTDQTNFITSTSDAESIITTDWQTDQQIMVPNSQKIPTLYCEEQFVLYIEVPIMLSVVLDSDGWISSR